MTTMKLYIPKSIKVILVVFWLIIALAGLLSLIWFFNSGGLKTPSPLIWGLYFLGTAGWLLSLGLRLPHTIQYSGEDFCELTSTIRKIPLRPSDIISIKPWSGGLGFLAVKHRAGTIVILNQFDGFHGFIAHLKNHNPGIEIRGC